MFAPATLSEYLGLPLDFGDRVDLGGATAAGMVWRAAAAVELGQCDAVLVVMPGSTEIPRSEARPGRTLSWYGASSNDYGSPQAEFEIPYGNVGQNGPVRADRAALRRRIRLRRSGAGANRGAAARERVRTPGRGVPRQADHRRRRAEQPGDRRPHPHAGDRDAGAGRCGCADRERRRRAAGPSSSGVDQGFRRAHPVQDADVRRRPRPHTDRPCRRTGVRDGRRAAVGRRHGVDLRLLHDHGADDVGGRRLLRQGRGHGVADGARPDLSRRLPGQHRGRAAVVRAGGHGRAACTTSSTAPAR